MIPINPTVKLIIALVLVGGVGALQAIIRVEPTWTWITTVVQIAMAAELYFTVPAKQLDAVKRAAKVLGPLGILVTLVVILAGCAQAAATIPADVILIECVADDAVAQKPIPQIVTDCGTDLDTVVAILLASKKPSVAGSPAALAAKAAHASR